MITRCNTCLMPTTRPDTQFVDGKCSACVAYEARPEIDWEQREDELVRILERAPRSGGGYDCIVPSSGGKDSTYQVVKLLELGARPLVVTATTDFLTPIGRRNIDNLAKLATTIEVTPNRSIRAALCRLGLELVGDISWPEHASIFSIPFRIARDMNIPLIFYGECPQNEYGGPLKAQDASQMTQRWVSEFGGLLGLRPIDMADMGESISNDDMLDYVFPPNIENVTAYFLGQFVEWDSRVNAEVAVAHGFEEYPWGAPCTGSWWRFENLDNAMTGLHDHGGYRKYGYGRACAQISVDIRRGHITRSRGLAEVMERDGTFPHVYAGVPLSDVLAFLERDRAWLEENLDAHTNWDLFSETIHGRPLLKEDELEREEM